MSGTWTDKVKLGFSAGTGWILAFFIIGLTLIVHLSLAANFPLSNDESYYWDWGQKLQLSYYDHPPGIAWITAINARLGSGLWAVRLLIPFMHALASLFLLLCLREIKADWRPRDFFLLVLAAALLPGFSLLGIFALPDAGLYPCISAALWLALRFYPQERLNIVQGASLGLLLGLAGIFKYHALPIGGGLLLALLATRRQTIRQDLGFWVSVVLAGLLMTTPVWVWNIQHDWASIRYQTQHGMGGLKLQWSGGLRSVLGMFLFVTPLMGWLLIRTVSRLLQKHSTLPAGAAALILGASLPVLILVGGISFFKPILLHWLMPGLWLLLPAMVALFADRMAEARRTWILGFCLSLILPSLLANRSFRHKLLETFGEKLGPLMELTVWTELNTAVHAQMKHPHFDQPAHCPTEGYLAGQRWFVVSQLHFLNKGSIATISLDRNNPSYYTFRDEQRNWVGCAVSMVVAAQNFRKADFMDMVEIESIEPVKLQLHASQKYLLVTGRLIAPPQRVLKPSAGPVKDELQISKRS